MFTKIYEFLAELPMIILGSHGGLILCSLTWITVVGFLTFRIIRKSR